MSYQEHRSTGMGANLFFLSSYFQTMGTRPMLSSSHLLIKMTGPNHSWWPTPSPTLRFQPSCLPAHGLHDHHPCPSFTPSILAYLLGHSYPHPNLIWDSSPYLKKKKKANRSFLFNAQLCYQLISLFCHIAKHHKKVVYTLCFHLISTCFPLNTFHQAFISVTPLRWPLKVTTYLHIIETVPWWAGNIPHRWPLSSRKTRVSCSTHSST